MENTTRPETVHLGFVGDLLLGRKVRRKIIEGQPPAAMWGDLRARHLAAEEKWISCVEELNHDGA